MPASPACWPMYIAGLGLPMRSPTCIPVCPPMIHASCSPPCWPTPPTSASAAWPMPARSQVAASSPGLPVSTCVRTPIGMRVPSWSRPSTANRSPHCSGRPTCPARTARVSPPRDTAGRGEAIGAINAHYGREASALFYTHISGRHAPYHTIAIPPSGEAASVIDGLLYHEADLSISVHHTDGGGVSDHVFALAHLLGFRFAPRIPNIADRKLYAFGPASNWPALTAFIAGRPHERLITAHWDDVLRLAASIRTGTVSASLMLKRLGAYPRQHGVALALREIGRIERTLYTLDWLERVPLRRQTTAELNKGESRN